MPLNCDPVTRVAPIPFQWLERLIQSSVETLSSVISGGPAASLTAPVPRRVLLSGGDGWVSSANTVGYTIKVLVAQASGPPSTFSDGTGNLTDLVEGETLVYNSGTPALPLAEVEVAVSAGDSVIVEWLEVTP